jgi:hypothetical protein
VGTCPESFQPKRIEVAHKESQLCTATAMGICPESFQPKRIEVAHKESRLCTAAAVGTCPESFQPKRIEEAVRLLRSPFLSKEAASAKRR